MKLTFGTGLICLAGIMTALCACGCATSARVERISPAPYNAGAASQLSLVQINGRPDLKNLLTRALQDKTYRSGWWTFRNSVSESIALFPDAAPGSNLRGRAPGEGEIFVRLDAYDAVVLTPDHDRKNKPGEQHPPKGQVRVRFAASVIEPSGRILMAEREYSGLAEGDIQSVTRREYLISAAALNGVARFLADITPRRIREAIVIDKDAEDMKPIAKLVANGQYAQATDKLESIRKTAPRRADVVYNLAVLTDARGEYEKALELYGEALRLGFKDYYAKTRDACQQRLNERESLNR